MGPLRYLVAVNAAGVTSRWPAQGRRDVMIPPWPLRIDGHGGLR